MEVKSYSRETLVQLINHSFANFHIFSYLTFAAEDSAIDENHQYVLVGDQSLKYLRILSHESDLHYDIKDKYLKIVENIGNNRTNLLWIDYKKAIISIVKRATKQNHSSSLKLINILFFTSPINYPYQNPASF